jgi:hypothetical protein
VLNWLYKLGSKVTESWERVLIEELKTRALSWMMAVKMEAKGEVGVSGGRARDWRHVWSPG